MPYPLNSLLCIYDHRVRSLRLRPCQEAKPWGQATCTRCAHSYGWCQLRHQSCVTSLQGMPAPSQLSDSRSSVFPARLTWGIGGKPLPLCTSRTPDPQSLCNENGGWSTLLSGSERLLEQSLWNTKKISEMASFVLQMLHSVSICWVLSLTQSFQIEYSTACSLFLFLRSKWEGFHSFHLISSMVYKYFLAVLCLRAKATKEVCSDRFASGNEISIFILKARIISADCLFHSGIKFWWLCQVSKSWRMECYPYWHIGREALLLKPAVYFPKSPIT